MAKTKISEFSSTAGSNTDIDGINIAEGCAPSGINDAIRELMAQLKDFQTGAQGDSFNGPVGTSTAAAGAFTTLTASSTATLNTLASSGATLTGGSINNMAIGGTTAAAASVTTLTTSSTVTLNGGTANGVAYLNGSKVLTTGSALTFDGTNLGLNATPTNYGTNYRTFALNAVSGSQIDFQVGGTVKNFIYGSSTTFQYDSATNHAWSLSGSEQMRLTSTGLGIGTTSADPISAQVNGLSIRGAVGDILASAGDTPVLQIARRGSDGGVIQFYKNTTAVGSVSTTSVLTTYNTTSDYRLKNVIGAVIDAGSRIDALEPVEYEWKSEGSRTRGFLAHKFQEVYPSSVTGTKDAVDEKGKPVYQGMQAGSSEVIADLVAEIQSLRQRLAAAGIA